MEVVEEHLGRGRSVLGVELKRGGDGAGPVAGEVRGEVGGRDGSLSEASKHASYGVGGAERALAGGEFVQ